MANWQARAFRVTSSSPRLPVLAPPAVRLPHQRSELRVLKGGEHERQHPVKVAAVPNPGVHDRCRGWIDGGIVPNKLTRLQACSFLHLLVELVADFPVLVHEQVRTIGTTTCRLQCVVALGDGLRVGDTNGLRTWNAELTTGLRTWNAELLVAPCAARRPSARSRGL